MVNLKSDMTLALSVRGCAIEQKKYNVRNALELVHCLHSVWGLADGICARRQENVQIAKVGALS